MNMKKTTLIASLFCLVSLFAKAEGNKVYFSWSASANAGYIMHDGKVDAKLGGEEGSLAYPLARPVLGAKLAMEMRPTKGRAFDALSDWNDASAGVALDYLNLGNNEWLGNIIAPYTYVRVPIVRLPHFELGIRPGIGMAFSTKTYTNTIPEDLKYQYLYQRDGMTIANQCVGSFTNFYFAEALYLEFPIKSGFSVVATGGWYHVSNGSTIQPNSGYNMLNAELGLRYTPQESKEAEERLTARRVGPKKLGLYEGKRWDVEASGSGWFRQVYYKDRMTFGVASMSVAAHYRPWAIFKIGGGVDVFYDGAYMPHETKFGKTAVNLATAADCWRLGISLQPEFVIGNFTAGFHFGAYMLDGVKNLEAEVNTEDYYKLFPEKDPQNQGLSPEAIPAGERLHKPIFYKYDLLGAGSAGKPDGWMYTRILLKYRPTNHFFVQLGMKAHLTKAEFVDMGLGVCF